MGLLNDLQNKRKRQLEEEWWAQAKNQNIPMPTTNTTTTIDPTKWYLNQETNNIVNTLYNTNSTLNPTGLKTNLQYYQDREANRNNQARKGMAVIKGLTDISEGVSDTVTYRLADVMDFFGNKDYANSLRKQASKDSTASRFVLDPLEENFKKKSTVSDEELENIRTASNVIGKEAMLLPLTVATGGVGRFVATPLISAGETYGSSRSKAYNNAIKQGLSEEEADKYASDIAWKTTASDIAFRELAGVFGKVGTNILGNTNTTSLLGNLGATAGVRAGGGFLASGISGEFNALLNGNITDPEVQKSILKSALTYAGIQGVFGLAEGYGNYKIKLNQKMANFYAGTGANNSEQAKQKAFEILGVKENATAEEINKAYRNLAKQYHSDITGNSDEAMTIINQAKDIALGGNADLYFVESAKNFLNGNLPKDTKIITQSADGTILAREGGDLVVYTPESALEPYKQNFSNIQATIPTPNVNNIPINQDLVSKVAENQKIEYNVNTELSKGEINRVKSAINTDTPNLPTGDNYKLHGNNLYLFTKNGFDNYDFKGKISISGNEDLINEITKEYRNYEREPKNNNELLNAEQYESGVYNSNYGDVKDRPTTTTNDTVLTELSRENGRTTNINTINENNRNQIENSNMSSFNLPENVKEIKNTREWLRKAIQNETEKEWVERLKGAQRSAYAQDEWTRKNQSPLQYRREVIQQYLDYKNETKNVDNQAPTSNPDIFKENNTEYSIKQTTTDNYGKTIPKGLQEYLKDSKTRDEDGRLKELYHGTATGKFEEFDNTKLSPESDWGKGIYLTDDYDDVYNNYYEGGADFDNKISRRAEEIESETDLSYEEAKEQAEKELFKDGYLITSYAKIDNPAIVGQTQIFDLDDYYSNYDESDFDSEDEYQEAIDQLIADDVEKALYNIENEYNLMPGDSDKISQILWESIYNGDTEIQSLKDKFNNEFIEVYDENGNLATNDLVRIIIQSQGYDGIIDSTVSTKFKNMYLNDGTTHYIAFNSNQIKDIDNQNPTESPNIFKEPTENYLTKDTDNSNIAIGGDENGLTTLQRRFNTVLNESAKGFNEETGNKKLNGNNWKTYEISKETTTKELSNNKVNIRNRRLLKDFASKGYIDLNGTTVNNIEDVAEISQIFRNPLYETFRILYTKGNTIVGQEATSSRITGMADVSPYRNNAKTYYKINDRMRRLNADGFYLIHNHPSGDVKPSKPDIEATNSIIKNVKGFKGHVVINSGTYGILTADDENIYEKYGKIKNYKPDYIDKMMTNELWNNIAIKNPDNILELSYDLKNNPNYSSLIITDSKNHARIIVDLPNSFFNMSKSQIDGYIKNVAQKNGGDKAFISTQDMGVFMQSNNLQRVEDVVLYNVDSDGNLYIRKNGISDNSQIFDKEIHSQTYKIKHVGEENSRYDLEKNEENLPKPIANNNLANYNNNAIDNGNTKDKVDQATNDKPSSAEGGNFMPELTENGKGDIISNTEKGGETPYENEFRKLQEESRRELNKDSRQRRNTTNNEEIRERLSTNLPRELDSRGYNTSTTNELVLKSNKNTQFNMYEDVDNNTFHDIFEVVKNFTRNGELVDLHEAEDYEATKNYLSTDGLSGFAITEDGDLISVFNASDKKGFLDAISSVVKRNVKTLDCYVSPNQNLQEMYQKKFGFKTASIMDYNMEYDHDNIAKNHNNPQVAFMVNTDRDVKTRHFNKDQYDEALNYRNSYLNDENSSTSSFNLPVKPTTIENKTDLSNKQQTNLPPPNNPPKPPTSDNDDGKIAEVLTKPTKQVKPKERALMIARANFFDKDAVFEDLAKKTHNRQLEAVARDRQFAGARGQNALQNPRYEFDSSFGKQSKKQISKALNDIIDEVGEENIIDFQNYMYHLLNTDRMTLVERGLSEKNKPVFGNDVTADISKAEVEKYEKNYPEFKEYAQDVYDYLKADKEELVKAGVISRELSDKFEEMYPHYVPIHRVDNKGNAINVPLDTGRTGINNPIKKATGGNSNIEPLFHTIASRTMQTYNASARNKLGLELLKTLGNENITENTSNTDTEEILDTIADTDNNGLTEGNTKEPPTFTVFKDGEKITYQITPDMYSAIKSRDPNGLYKFDNTKLSKGLRFMNTLRRGLLTEYNPAFAITNPIRDLQDVILNSQHAGKTFTEIPEAIMQMATNGYWYKEYMQNGGQDNSYFKDGEFTEGILSDKKKLPGVIEMGKKVLKILPDINNFIERTPRFAEYIASRKSGKSIEESMLDARQVTTDFNAGGDVTKFVNRNLAPFLNASTQGFNQQIRNIRNANQKGLRGYASLVIRCAILGLTPLILNTLLHGDDKDFEELNDYVKDNYYVLGKNEDGSFVRIPKGRATSVIQKIFKNASDYITGDKEVNWEQVTDDFWENLAFAVDNVAPNNPFTNNTISPIVDVANNKTWYGEDLVPSRLQNVPEEQQYDESTDKLSIAIGQALGWSPYKINYLLDQYSGAIGDVLLPLGTPQAENNMMEDKFTTNSTLNNKYPGEFYDTKEKLEKESKKTDATDMDILKNKYLNTVSSDLSDLYKFKREMQMSETLTDDEKKKKVKETQYTINELCKKALNNLDKINISGDTATVGGYTYKKNDKGEWVKQKDSTTTSSTSSKKTTTSGIKTKTNLPTATTTTKKSSIKTK